MFFGVVAGGELAYLVIVFFGEIWNSSGEIKHPPHAFQERTLLEGHMCVLSLGARVSIGNIVCDLCFY